MINEPVKPAPTTTQDQHETLPRHAIRQILGMFAAFLVRFGGRPETRGALLTTFLYLLRDTHGVLKVRKKINGEDNENVVMLCVSKRQDIAFAGEAHEGKHCNAQ